MKGGDYSCSRVFLITYTYTILIKKKYSRHMHTYINTTKGRKTEEKAQP